MDKIAYYIDGKTFYEAKELYMYLKGRMTKQVYLYGIKIEGLDTMLYKDVLDLKLELSEILVRRLLKPRYAYRDDARLKDTLDSQKFNQMLLDEFKEVS